MPDLEKLIASLSDEAKEALVKLITQGEEEKETKKKTVRKKKDTRPSKIKIITAQELAKSGGISNEEKKSLLKNNGVDNVIEKQIKSGKLQRTERITRSTIIPVTCVRCGKKENASSALLKTSGRERYYICNNCDAAPTIN